MKYKLAVVGIGKTGGRVLALAKKQGREVSGYDSHNPPTLEQLKDCAAILCFLPGAKLDCYLSLFLQAGRPVISGSTGYHYPSDMDQQCIQQNTTWISSHNFAMGMAIFPQILSRLGSLSEFYPEGQFEMEEIHHQNKRDAPSGTALHWKDWLGHSVEIRSKRVGDEVGTHTLTFQSAYERITLSHQSLDRDVFAAGALWTVDQVLKESQQMPSPGFYSWSRFIQKIFPQSNQTK